MNPVYVLYGPESGERIKAIAAIRDQLASIHGDGLEEVKYYGGEDSPGKIISALSNGALFASHSLAVVVNAEAITKKSDIKQFADYLARRNPAVTLVFTSEESRLEKSLVNLAEEKARKIFWELFENQKEGWVVSYLRKRDAIITPEALELFLSLVENNTQEMGQELEKILLLAPEGQERFTIGEDLVENYIYHSKEETVYSLFAAYARRDFTAALEILQKLRGAKSGEETGILIRMGFQLRQLASLSAIRDQRPVQNSDYVKLKIFGKINQRRYAELLPVLDSAAIRGHLASCGEFEMELRRQKSAMHSHIIQLWLYSLFYPVRGRLSGKTDRRLFTVNSDRFV